MVPARATDELHDMLDRKAKGKDVVTESGADSEDSGAKVLDLMAALQASVDKADRKAPLAVTFSSVGSADPDGSADDVLALMLEVQQRVKERLGVVLRAEVRMSGFDDVSTSTLAPGTAPRC